MNHKYSHAGKVFLLAALILLPFQTSAAVFGSEDVGTTDYPGFFTYNSGGSNFDAVNAIAIGSDDSVYAGGYSGSDGNTITLFKYLSSGEIDESWGTNGSTSFSVATASYLGLTGMDLDGSDNLYTVGRVGSNSGDWLIRKFDDTGAVDTDWGSSGIVTYNGSTTASHNDLARAVVATADGEIYVAGSNNAAGVGDMAVRKYDAAGDLDTTWGDSGMVTYDSGVADAAFAVTRDASGNVYIGGRQNTNSGDWVIVRYTSAGDLDTTWGDSDSGIIVYNSGGGSDTVGSLVADSVGNLYVAGSHGSNGNDIAVHKYDSAGDLDTAWGTSGISTYNSGASQSDTGSKVTIDSDGNSYVFGTGNGNFVTLKYDADGDLDTSWGDSGVVTHDSGGTDTATAMDMDSDGNIHGGGAWGVNGTDFATLKLTSDGVNDPDWGDTTLGAFPEGNVLASEFELLEAADVSSVSFYSHSATGNVRLAIYDSLFDLVWESGSIANDAAGALIEASIADGTPTTLTGLAAGTYYLALQVDTDEAVPSFTRGSAGAGLLLEQAYGAFPADLDDAIETAHVWTIFSTYTLYVAPVEEESSGSTSSHRRSGGSSSSDDDDDSASGEGSSAEVEALMQQLLDLLTTYLQLLIAQRGA